MSEVSISLIITTHNRGLYLEKSLQRLCMLTLPDELIVVDDGGTDAPTTENAVLAFENVTGVHSTYVYNANPGPTICSLARNIGVRAARNEWIVTSEPELLYVTDILKQFPYLKEEHPGQVISAGSIFFAPEGWVPGDHPKPLEWHGSWESAIGWVAPHTAIYEKAWLEEIGGWDESFPGSWGWDDTDLLTRLRLMGHGQQSALSLEAIHMYHGLGGDDFGYNEQHFLAKSFNQDETDLSEVVANRGSWGVLKGVA